LVDGLERHFKARITVEAFEQHTLRAGTDANALASVRVLVDGVPAVACWIDENTAAATLQAVLSAVGRALRSLGNTSSFH